MNRSYFFARVKQSLFGGKLSATQIQGMTASLDYWDKNHAGSPLEFLAYILATDKHESAHTMQAVREIGKGKGHKYGLPAGPYGHIYYGRGKPQTTWLENYQKVKDGTGVDVVRYPDKLLELEFSTRVLFIGMFTGKFWTGKKLADYWRNGSFDAMGARSIVQGHRRKPDGTREKYAAQAALVAGLHAAFLDALKQASARPPTPAPMEAPAPVEAPQAQEDSPQVDPAPAPITGPPEDQATGKPLSKSTTAGAAAAAGAAGSVAPAVEAIKQAQEAATAGKGVWDVALSAGPWVLLALIIIGAAGWIIYQRFQKSKHEGV